MTTTATEPRAPAVEGLIADFTGKINEAITLNPQLVQNRKTPRGAHPRDHGLVTAEFVVKLADVPQDLRRGIFAADGTYPALIRFSNAGTGPHDGERDARGMAIKLLGVKGDRLIADPSMPEDEATTQDFLLTSFPVFIARTAAHFHEFMQLRQQIAEARRKEPPDTATIQGLLNRLFAEFPLMEKSRSIIRNPLSVGYYSQTAYELGAGSRFFVKYHARPHLPDTTDSLSESQALALDKHFLQAAMRETLRTGKAVFDFMIQRQKADMPEDNPTVEWDQAKSPFEKVATVEIPAQDFESEARKRLAEDISYSPWHGIRDHRPIGDINEARLEVYRASVRLRHERNRVQYSEPRLDT